MISPDKYLKEARRGRGIEKQKLGWRCGGIFIFVVR